MLGASHQPVIGITLDHEPAGGYSKFPWYAVRENYVDAISFFDQALALKPNSPDIWNLKGVALRSLGRYDEASECYNKSLELDPRDKASS